MLLTDIEQHGSFANLDDARAGVADAELAASFDYASNYSGDHSSAPAGGQPSGAPGPNYFNYFTEVEDEFVKRRGSHMLVSPLDWSLIETWKQRGIPLHVVLRGINASFDGYNRKAQRGRKVNSLLYCQQEVESLFLQYRGSRVGENQPAAANGNGAQSATAAASSSPFSPAAVLEFLAERRDLLADLKDGDATGEAARETFARVVVRLDEIIAAVRSTAAFDPEALETDLTMIEEVIIDGVKLSLGDDALKQLRRDAERQLRPHRERMTREIYEQTLDNYVARRLREQHRIPRLSLFYLQ